MSVLINEVEVQPRRQQPADAPQQGQRGGGEASGTSSPEPADPDLQHKVAGAVALLHSRNVRLCAD
ncbi:MAG TPA: hypothetical protein VGQ38_05370 [Gaiellaceae bacterium]|jgi:hypothetical protein|nr:hypothetical protein [Gaiellaceae bacterium]